MPPRAHDLTALLSIAHHQAGVVGDADLRRCGFSAAATARRVRDGRWQRIGGATLVAASTPGSTDKRVAWILRHTYGDGSIVSGAVALRRAQWSLPADDMIVVASHRVRHPLSDVTVLRRAPGRYEVAEGVAFAHPADAFCDLLITASAKRRRDLIDFALQRRWVDAATFRPWIQPRLGHGKTGARILRTALDRMESGSRSEAEQRMARLLKRSGTGPWATNYPVIDEQGAIAAEIDFADPELFIAIEVDGRAYHSDRHAFEHDRARQNVLVLQGWLVLRFTWEQITGDPMWVIETIRRAAHQRRLLLRANQLTG